MHAWIDAGGLVECTRQPLENRFSHVMRVATVEQRTMKVQAALHAESAQEFLEKLKRKVFDRTGFIRSLVGELGATSAVERDTGEGVIHREQAPTVAGQSLFLPQRDA